MVCVDPEDPDETRRECLLRRLNRGIKLAEDIGLAIGIFNISFNLIISSQLLQEYAYVINKHFKINSENM